MDKRADELSRALAKGVDRRDFIKKALRIGSVAYVAPAILASAEAASAQAVTPPPRNPNPECVGATCTTFRQCSSNPDCVCTTTFSGGGFCIPGSTQCAGLTRCPSGACPAGSLCVINSCCNEPVCVSTSLTCPPSQQATSRPVIVATSASGPTIAAR